MLFVIFILGIQLWMPKNN